jgi:hypothetical protein
MPAQTNHHSAKGAAGCGLQQPGARRHLEDLLLPIPTGFIEDGNATPDSQAPE